MTADKYTRDNLDALLVERTIFQATIAEYEHTLGEVISKHSSEMPACRECQKVARGALSGAHRTAYLVEAAADSQSSLSQHDNSKVIRRDQLWIKFCVGVDIVAMIAFAGLIIFTAFR